MTVMADYGDYVAIEVEPAAIEVERPEPVGEGDMVGFLVTLSLFGLVAVCVGLASYTCHLNLVREPGYSVRVSGVRGLDPWQQSPAVSPAFNLTVQVDNTHHLRRVCKEESRVMVYYNEASEGAFNETSIGWGDLPAFCVGRWSTMHLDVSLAHRDGVLLSRRLRDKMESDRRQSRGMKLDVEIKPARPEEASRPCLTMCEAKVGDSAAAMPCNQFCGTERKRLYYKNTRTPIHLLFAGSPF